MKKHRLFKFLLFSTLVLLFFNCNNPVIFPPDNAYKVTITQGVWGNVWFWDGNFMPSTDNSSSGKITAVSRNIYVYEATRFDEVVKDSIRFSFYKEINSKYIDKVTSDKDGFFQISLQPGKYSFFVKEDSLFYASLMDGSGHLEPAEVRINSVTKKQIDINYKAAY